MSAETFGPYRIEELLDRGGMGEVHRADDTGADRRRRQRARRAGVAHCRKCATAADPAGTGHHRADHDRGHEEQQPLATVMCTRSNTGNPRFAPPSEAYFHSFADRAAQDAFFQQLVTTFQLRRDELDKLYYWWNEQILVPM